MFLIIGRVIRIPLTINHLKISKNIQKERRFFLKLLLFLCKKTKMIKIHLMY